MDEEKFQAEMKNVIEGELLQPTVLTSEDRQQKAQEERHEQLMRRLDSLEERIRTIYQGVRVLQDHVRSSARQIKDIYELVFVAIGSLLVYVIIEGLKSIFGDVVVWLFWTGLVVYFVWRWWRHIVKDPPPMAS